MKTTPKLDEYFLNLFVSFLETNNLEKPKLVECKVDIDSTGIIVGTSYFSASNIDLCPLWRQLNSMDHPRIYEWEGSNYYMESRFELVSFKPDLRTTEIQFLIAGSFNSL